MLPAWPLRLALALSFAAWGDPTIAAVPDGGVTVTGSASTLNFPVACSGDTSYDTFVRYQTADGSAKARVDYTVVQIRMPVCTELQAP